MLATLGLAVPPVAMLVAAIAMLAVTDTQPPPPFAEVTAAEPFAAAAVRNFRDAQPWPDGIVIAPPRTADTMAVVPDLSHDAGDWPHGMVIRPAAAAGWLSALLAPVSTLLM